MSPSEPNPAMRLLPWLTAAAIWAVLIWSGVAHSGSNAPGGVVIARTN